jgi:hypothetical protein
VLHRTAGTPSQPIEKAESVLQWRATRKGTKENNKNPAKPLT